MDLSIVKQRKLLRKRGVTEWNNIRVKYPLFVPCLAGGIWEMANLSWANLRGVNLSGASLSRVNFTQTDLRGANLSMACLRDSFLTDADLSHANLTGADLTDCNLNGTVLKNANLTHAKLVNVAVADENGISTTDVSDAIIDNTLFTSEEQTKAGSGFLELTTIDTLDKANFVRPSDLYDYIERAFKYTQNDRSPENNQFPTLVEQSLNRIKAIRKLFQYNNVPDQLVVVVNHISKELIRYLKEHPRELHNIRPRQFEELVAEILLCKGWEVQLTPQTRDGGYDIYAISNRALGHPQQWLIECKKYAAENTVGIGIVRALYGVRALRGLENSRLMLATTSRFTQGVENLATSRYDLYLRDYSDVIEWIREYQ